MLIRKRVRMKNWIGIILIAWLVSAFASASELSSSVRWLSFEEAIELSKSEPRKIFIDVYTDWCGWCKKMDAGTFSDPAVAKILNEQFYPVKLNAEQREIIKFDGREFEFVGEGRRGYHQLAAALLDGKMSYPSVVFLNEDLEKMQVLAGYHNASSFHQIVSFIGLDHFETMSWKEYQKEYESPYGD